MKDILKERQQQYKGCYYIKYMTFQLTISPEDLVPKLPSPRDLQPFPTSEALVMRGHEGLVRSVDFDPAGQYVVSGGDDCTLRGTASCTGRFMFGCLNEMSVFLPSLPTVIIPVNLVLSFWWYYNCVRVFVSTFFHQSVVCDWT